jgi:uncharacterized membrane protein
MVPMDRISLVGRVFFAIGRVAFGILHVIYGDFVTRVVPGWPAWIPARLLWVYLTGATLIAGGAAILFGIELVMLHIPRAVAATDATRANETTAVFEALAFSGLALLLASPFRFRLSKRA